MATPLKKVMVTGSAGFIGSAVVLRLKALGTQVVEFNLPDHDIQDPDDVMAMMEGCEAVIHLAGVLGTHELFDTPRLAVDVNIHGSLNVLEACRAHNAAYLGITMPQVFPSIYTSTKVATTKLASAYAHTHGLKVGHVRAFNAFGPGQAHGPGHPQKIIPTFAYNITHGLPVPIWGDGKQGVDLIYTSDLARVLCDAVAHVVLYGRGHRLNDLTFDGGTGKMFTVMEAARMVHEQACLVMEESPPFLVEFLPMRRGEVPTMLVAEGENWDLLGYKDSYGEFMPRYETHQMRETVKFYKDYVIK